MLKNIIQGVKAYFGTLKLIGKLKLWKFFLVPIIISLVVGGSIGWLAISFSDELGHFFAKIWTWKWGKETFESIVTFIGGLTIAAIGLVLYKHIVMALASPFMSPVSEKIEAYYHQKNELSNKLVHRKTSFQEQLVRGIRINGRNLCKELFYTIALLILSLIPVVNLVTTPLIFIVQAYYAGFGNMDYTLERHFNYKESVKFVTTNKGIAIGNGLVFTLLLLVPVVGFIIVLPLSVTASTITTIERIHSVSAKRDDNM